MDGLQTILGRRSIRKYQQKPIQEEVLRNILMAGMCAPSAHNSQPWEFIVVRDRVILESLSGCSQYWGMLKEADAAVITLANTENYHGSTQDFFIQDCAAATENMLLAAHAQGLGGVYLGLYGREDRMKMVRSALNIPQEILPFSAIALGYPAEEKHPHTTFKENKVHYERYGSQKQKF